MYVAIQLHQKKSIKLAEFLPPSTTGAQTLATSPNSLSQLFTKFIRWCCCIHETQWLHMVMSYHAHAQSNNTPSRYGTSEMLHHPGASLSE